MKLRERIRQIFSQNASPRAVATGGSVGTFLGFFPFFPIFGLKTLLSYAVTFFLRGSTPVAVLAVTIHDFLLPIYPVVLRLEYQIGFWLLSHPHHFAPKIRPSHLNFDVFHHWGTFLKVGMPTLLGSFLIGLLVSGAAYLLLFWFATQRQQRLARVKEPYKETLEN